MLKSKISSEIIFTSDTISKLSELSLNYLNGKVFLVTEDNVKKHCFGELTKFINHNNIITSVIGEESEINIFLDFLKQIATIDKISLTEPIFNKNDLLNILTEKQRLVLITAKQPLPCFSK